MAFNISEFRSNIDKRGLAKNNLFLSTFTLPNTLSFIESYIPNRDLQFLCKSVSIPGMDVQTQDFRPQGWGKIEKRPTDFSKGSLSMIFMIDGEFATMKYFHRWMQGIVNYGGLSSNSEDPQGKLPYEFAYKDDYVSPTVSVTVFANNNLDQTYTYIFTNVYPTSMGNVDVSWENGAEIMTITITFSYDDMFNDATESGTGKRSLYPSSDPLKNIGATLNSTTIPSLINDLTAPIRSLGDRLSNYFR
jgi:hypothetical protein